MDSRSQLQTAVLKGLRENLLTEISDIGVIVAPASRYGSRLKSAIVSTTERSFLRQRASRWIGTINTCAGISFVGA